MRSRSNFFRLSSFILIIMLLIIAGFNSNGVRASFQATAAATMAAGAAACPPSVTAFTPPPPRPPATQAGTAAAPAATPAATTAGAAPAATTSATAAATAMATAVATTAPTAAATAAAAMPVAMKPVLAQTAAATAAAPAGPSAALTGEGCLFAAALSGAAEVPNPGAPEGTGVAVVLVNAAKSEVCYELTVEGITLPAAAAHIHKAAAGVAGPVVVPFTAPDANGKAMGCVTGVAADIVQGLLTAPADYYVNVHTSDFPGGAVRGQLYGATKLTGAAEKPNPGDPDGVGAASVWIDPQAGRLCYAVQVYGITLPAAAAHIHRGAPDASGPVIIPFPAAPGENGSAAACTAGANTTVVQDVLANAGSYYVNVHTGDFAAGAVRGQLSTAAK